MSELLSINVSAVKTVEMGRRGAVETGIYKTPVTGAVMLHRLNIEGDKQADLVAHGGPWKAVYVYSHDHYAHWADFLGRDDLSYGQFGENFTVSGMLETEVMIGDTYQVGDAIVQVTQPRVPCFKLTHKMDAKSSFQKAFLQSHRVGFYLRVVQVGMIEAGQAIQLVQRDPREISVHDINHLLYTDNTNVDVARRALEIESLSPGWVGSMEQIIAKHG